jgi:hypothetical protein
MTVERILAITTCITGVLAFVLLGINLHIWKNMKNNNKSHKPFTGNYDI